MIRPSTRLLRLLLAIGCVMSVAACEDEVAVSAPRPDAAAKRLCHALHDRLPGKAHGQSRRKTKPDSRLVAAWGSPAIGLRCGVPRPSGLRPESVLAETDGISWYPEPPDRPVTFTALGRRAYVQVTIPGKYSPPAEVLADLTAAIKAALPAKPHGEL